MSSPLDLFFFGLNRRPGRLPRCSELCEGSFFKAHLLEIIETGNEWNEWKLKQKAMKLQQSGPILERYAVPRRETSRLLHHTKHRYVHCFFSISSMNSVVFHGIFMAFPFLLRPSRPSLYMKASPRPKLQSISSHTGIWPGTMRWKPPWKSWNNGSKWIENQLVKQLLIFENCLTARMFNLYGFSPFDVNTEHF